MAFGREDVIVRFGGDASGLNRSLSQVDAGISRLRGAFAGLAGAFTVGAFANFAKQTLSWADALANTSQRIGVSTERIQALRNEAEKLGLSFQQVDDGLTRFSVELGKARNGTGELGKSLEAYRIALRSADGQWRSASDILQDYTDLMRGMGDETEKNRLSNVAFGRGNIELGQTLANLQGTLDEVTNQHREFARVLDDESVQALANLETRYTETMQTIATTTKSALVYAADELSQFWNGLKTIGGKVLFGFKWEPGQGAPPPTGTPAAPRVPVAVPGGAGASRSELAANAKQVVLAAEAAAGLPKGSLLALWGVESSYSTNLGLTSSAGAVGPFQIMPGTGAALGIDVRSADFQTQAKAAAEYLKQQFQAFGDLALAYAGYNAGPGAVQKYGGIPPYAETQAAVARFTNLRSQYLADSGLPDAEAYKQTLKEIEEQTKAAADARAEYDRVMQEGLSVRESVRTAAEQHAVVVERLVYLYQQGALGAIGSAGALETYRRAVAASAESLQDLKTKADDADSVAREIGLTFTSAFEDAVVAGNSLRDVLKGIAQDLLRLFVRKAVTEPFLELTKPFFSAIGSAIFGAPIKSALGNVMTSSGPMPLQRYSAGGIATSPQLALFGEGSGAEAYVPLPDGRRIPVAMKSPGVSVTVNNMPGQDARVRDDGRGGLTIDIVRAALADDARRGGVPWTRGLEAAYGLGRAR